MFFNPNQTEGGQNSPPCRRIAISPKPNLRWTSDQSVNSSLSVLVQLKKNRALYLSRFNRGGQTKFENTYFQIAKFRFSSIFNKFSEFSKKISGYEFKNKGPQILESSHLYTYLSFCKKYWQNVLKWWILRGIVLKKKRDK